MQFMHITSQLRQFIGFCVILNEVATIIIESQILSLSLRIVIIKANAYENKISISYIPFVPIVIICSKWSPDIQRCTY